MKNDVGPKSWVNAAPQTERWERRSRTASAPYNSSLIKTTKKERETAERKPNWPSIWKNTLSQQAQQATQGKQAVSQLRRRKKKEKWERITQISVQFLKPYMCGVKGNEGESEAVIIIGAICCSVMNAISFLSQSVSASYEVLASCQKAPAVLMWKKIARESLCIFHYSEDEKAAAESELPSNAGTPHRISH